MAIVNENMAMVHYLCQNGINIHERAYGAFFCPEDQKDGREDNDNTETINLDEDTSYQRYLYELDCEVCHTKICQNFH